jgi:hypothetical protein
LEEGLMYYFYYESTEGMKYFEKAQIVTGLKMKVIGKLGLRTKFQTHKVALLTLEAESKLDDENLEELKIEDENGENIEEIKPLVVELEEDSILLKTPKLFEEENETIEKKETNLKTIDQCIIMAFW